MKSITERAEHRENSLLQEGFERLMKPSQKMSQSKDGKREKAEVNSESITAAAAVVLCK